MKSKGCQPCGPRVHGLFYGKFYKTDLQGASEIHHLSLVCAANRTLFYVEFYNCTRIPIRAVFPPHIQRRRNSMRVVAISSARTNSDKQLLDAHHRLRARVFFERLGWEVDVVDGCEADRFDRLNPTYILVITNDDLVAGCARLLPAVGPTMASEVFPSLLPNGSLEAHSGMIESSRFCVDQTMGEGRGGGLVHEATLTMFAGIVEWCLVNAYSEIVTVTDLRFERLLAQVGWPFHRLAEPKKIGVTNAVAGILPATAEMFTRLRPNSYRSDFTSIGRAA